MFIAPNSKRRMFELEDQRSDERLFRMPGRYRRSISEITFETH